MTKPRVFISHSSKTDAAKDRLRAVAAELETRGFKSEVDAQFLQTNDDWYAAVNREMARSHGAIMLVDSAAEVSEYVRHEASVLGNRWHTEKDAHRPFVFMAALVDADPIQNAKLGSSDLLRLFGRAPKLDQNQRFRVPDGIIATRDVVAIARAIVDEFEVQHGPPWSDTSPVAHAQALVWEVLDPIVLQPGDKIPSAIGRLPDRPPELTDLKAAIAELGPKAHASHLATWLAKTASASAQDMADVIAGLTAAIRGLPMHARRALHRNLYVLHALWVANDNCPVTQCLQAHSGGVVGIKSNLVGEGYDKPEDRTYTRMLYPAHSLFEGKYTIVFFDEDEHDLRAMAQKLIEAVGVPGTVPDSGPTEMQKGLVGSQLTDKSLIGLLPSSYGTPEYEPLRATLTSQFPGVLFLIAVDASADEADIDAALPCVIDAYDPWKEASNCMYWRTALSAINDHQALN
ncbi:MAG: toll/interleukin-1 receptor domain-containing protein [Pseudomonadota bacterium]